MPMSGPPARPMLISITTSGGAEMSSSEHRKDHPVAEFSLMVAAEAAAHAVLAGVWVAVKAVFTVVGAAVVAVFG